ncbi:MAG: murein transglycosylase A [Lacisediminimonas sp.]|nr:murein transglycosylase A [Lacisediminimonas sp.]
MSAAYGLSRVASLLALAVAISLGGCAVTPPAKVEPSAPTAAPLPPTLQPVTFADIPGWNADDLREAWRPFLASCTVLVRKPEWKESCSVASSVDGADSKGVRLFFESFFTPHKVNNPDGSDRGLITGYYEPLLNGARKRGGPYQIPLFRVPDDMLVVDLSSVYPELKGMRLRGRVAGNKVIPYPTRAQMAQSNSLAGKELLWVDNAIDAFFLEVQGSGRVQLADTRETVRVAYADQNGHPYKSIGRYLVDKGEMTLDQASAGSIKAWFQANPARRQELLNANPSVVFFREEKLPSVEQGPNGSLGVPLTPNRSMAIDPRVLTLGAPVFLSTTQPNSAIPLQRLMLAQDTGGAIRGAVRGDFFWGFGSEAGELAGRMKQPGYMWLLLPKRPGS